MTALPRQAGAGTGTALGQICVPGFARQLFDVLVGQEFELLLCALR